MEIISVGDVVFVSFPFSDLSRSKLRPAVVLAYAQRDDWILCQVTSKSYADLNAIELFPEQFDTGGLNQSSYARPSKIFTAHQSIIQKKVGHLNSSVQTTLINAVKQILDSGLSTIPR